MGQIQVITGVERRRRFTAEERNEILAEAERTSVSEACRKYNLSRSLVHNWRARMARRNSDASSSEDNGAFVRLALPGAPEKRSGASKESAPEIRLQIGDDLTLAFPSTIAADELARFIAVLKAALG